jgi:membrane associated rhomboid family serine protease
MNAFRQSPFANITPVVKNLLIINIIFYIAMWVLPQAGIDLVELCAVYYFNSPSFKPWQIVSYMFMHSPQTFFHIAFNMFALFSFGPYIERVMGSKRFFNFYFITGIGALVLQMFVQAIEVYNITGAITVPHEVFSYNNNGNLMLDSRSFPGATYEDLQKLLSIYGTPMLGASGAIFGLLLAFGMLFPNVELFIMFIPVPVKAKYIMPCYILIELFLGLGQFSGDSVAHFAHLGGALFGFILLKIWGYRSLRGFY